MKPDPFELRDRVEIIAHRGFSAEAPENTIAALQAGLDAGADAVEFDLHTARDGTPVLLHDATLDRTTDARGRVIDRTAAELAELDAGSWFGPGFRGEPLPTLEAALEAIGRRADRIYAELKGTRMVSDLDGLVGIVIDAGALNKTIFISMDWPALQRVRLNAADALVGYIVDQPGRVESAIEHAAGDAHALLDFDARILLSDPPLAGRARARGIPLAAWTVDSVSDAADLVGMDVPRITTNRVRDLVRWRRSLKGLPSEAGA